MFQSLQIARALAAMAVVLFHAARTLSKENYFGASASGLDNFFWFGGEAGVAFFFVLSGFIIHRVHERDLGQPERLVTYAWRRLVRIFPVYWIIFAIAFLVARAMPSTAGSVPSDVFVLLRAWLLLPQDPQRVGLTGAPVLSVAWSLQYEMLFYAVFAAGIVSPRVFHALIVGLIGLVLYGQISAAPVFPLSFLSNPLILLFGMGMVVSKVSRWPMRPATSGWLAIVAMLAFVAMAVTVTCFRSSYVKAVSDLAYGVVSSVLTFALVSREQVRGERRQTWVGLLGGMLGDASYALYLIHLPLISGLAKISVAVLPKNEVGAAWAFLILVGGSVLAGVLFHLFVEKPLLDRLRGLVGKRVKYSGEQARAS